MTDKEPTRTSDSKNTDGGAFGHWTLDAAGLPAYVYEMDQYNDLRALYPNTQGLNRRDHWHQIGNDRVTGLASNDGTVQLYVADRGGTFVNRRDPLDDEPAPGLLPRLFWLFSRWYSQFRARQIERSWVNTVSPRGMPSAEPVRRAPRQREPSAAYAYVGGYSYLDDKTEVWASAYRYRPSGAQTRRVFGMGYYETETTHRNIQLLRHVYAPYGDDPALLIDVTLENLGAQPVDLRHYEYWDVNVYQLQLQWLRTGLAAPIGDQKRCAINEHFSPSIHWESDQRLLRFHQQPQQSPESCSAPDGISDIDWSPADVFLADLSGPPDAHYVDKFAFFGGGGPRKPDTIANRYDSYPDAPSTDPMPYCLVLRRDLQLKPGEPVRLRYAYGVVQPDRPVDFLNKYRVGEPLTSTLDCWKNQVVDFKTDDDLPLQREMAWHAYNLLSATVYNAYYDSFLVPQGSAYLYQHGADGAPRDQALFALPLVYLRPDLARSILCFLMRLTSAETGALPYAFSGHGFQSDGLGIHAAPSDLDLFFLMALAEYLSATGDQALLGEDVPFYPRGVQPAGTHGTTVLDHIRVAVTHLIEGVGIGEHGLIKIGDGDWSDAIVFETQLTDGPGPLGVTFEESKQNGESVPNTQMALFVLPLIAALIESHDAALADRIRTLLPGLRSAVEKQWTGRWYTRAILRNALNAPVTIGGDKINLESQPWALISGLAAETGTDVELINAILQYLDGPSPIGATLVEKGMTWPAVSQLLTWGYRRRRPDLAWRSLKKHTFATHAHEFPNVWINIWSGPDGINGKDAPNPGGTWASPVTPMLDFPVMNANQDAMALLALIRVCGMEPTGDGLIIAPKAPPERFVLDTKLLRLEVEPNRIAGQYRPIVNGSLTLHVQVPDTAADVIAVVGQTPVGASAPSVALPMAFEAGKAVTFEVTWK